ncbi:MAG: radical SAM protein [Clostridia bacterium]|nr:radical SAM protein [Clostridia bacterium]
MLSYIPGYVKLCKSGEFKNRVEKLKEQLGCCVLCPHQCRANRVQAKKGFCRAGESMVIDGYGPHFGEEKVLVGTGGSGTVFFSYCTLKCVFCQNYTISHQAEGRAIEAKELSHIMLSLQAQGCHNINLVSPTHFIPQIVESILLAAEEGLVLPIVYNTGGYEDIHTLKMLDGIIDIYMPDIKFGENETARKYIKSDNYFDAVKIAVKEMYKQVGDLKTDDRGIAYRGLLIRHLVMPNQLAGSREVFRFLREEISKDTLTNIMAQYYPAHESSLFPELARKISREEYRTAVQEAKAAGLKRLMTTNVF